MLYVFICVHTHDFSVLFVCLGVFAWLQSVLCVFVCVHLCVHVCMTSEYAVRVCVYMHSSSVCRVFVCICMTSECAVCACICMCIFCVCMHDFRVCCVCVYSHDFRDYILRKTRLPFYHSGTATWRHFQPEASLTKCSACGHSREREFGNHKPKAQGKASLRLKILSRDVFPFSLLKAKGQQLPSCSLQCNPPPSHLPSREGVTAKEKCCGLGSLC